jgi:diguanylate cyclase (GGDEF)-like protein/PAS domain S-box-containing protein
MTMDLSDALPDAVVVVDKRGRIVRANRATEALFGYSNDELLSFTLKDLMAASCHRQVALRVKSCFASPPVKPENLNCDLTVVTRAGQEVMVDLRLNRFDDGTKSYAVVAIREVSHQRNLAKQFAESEAHFRTRSVLSADWYWKQDANLRFTYISSDEEDKHLCLVENAIGKTRTELPYEWETPESRAEHERIINAREPFRDLLLHNTANDRFALVSGEPVFNDRGEFIGYQGISRNVTAEKRAERALRESESHFRSLTALSSDWYWRSDENHRFTFMHGENHDSQLINVDDIYGKTRFELPYVWESEKARADHKQALAKRELFRNLLLHNSENDRYALTSGEPLFDRQGKFVGYQGVSRDVTTEKRSERALRRSEARFRALTALSYDWYWEQDAELRFTVMAGVTEKAHLTTVESVQGKTRFELPYRWTSKSARNEHEITLTERKPFHDLLLHNAHNDRFALVCGEPMFDERGEFIGYQGVSRDVTTEKRAERALRQSETRFRALTALSSDWYWEQDADLRFTFISGVNDETHLTVIENVIGKTRLELPYIWESPAIRSKHEQLLAKRKPFRDLLLQNPENDRFALITGEPVFDENRKFIGYQGVSRDITAEKRSERALRESEARFRALTALSSDWYWEQDDQFRFIYFSPTAVDHAKLKIDSLVGRTRFDLPVVWESEACKQMHREALEGCLPFHDLLLRTESGDQYALVSGEPIFGEHGELKGYRGIARDVTAQKQAEAEALRLATYDPLTGLPNRTLLVDRIDRAIEQARRRKNNCVAVLFVDIDRFKTLNESYGHGAGDKVLRQFSGRLSDLLRAGDTLCRFGSDEFVAVLEDVKSVAYIETVANNILEVLSQPVDIDGVPYQTTASVGISLYPEDAGDVEKLLRNADLAMYEAKATGGGRFRFYADEMNRRVAARAKLERELRRAIDQEEFDIHLQPQYDIRTGESVGAEVLLRWHHPERGIVLPGEFLDVAEESGLIVQIEYLVIERTFNMIAYWRRIGVVPPRIAVNISSRQLLEGEALLARVKSLLETTGVPPELIEIEITESLLIPSEENSMTAVLEQLGRMGIRLAIDDFGTGYSSLSYLKRLPVNAVKIDQSFIRDLEDNEESTAIVRAVVGIARSMKLEVVTEGVETAEQLEILRAAGCDTYQGFINGKPMPRCEYEQKLLGIRIREAQRCHPLCGCTGLEARNASATKFGVWQDFQEQTLIAKRHTEESSEEKGKTRRSG